MSAPRMSGAINGVVPSRARFGAVPALLGVIADWIETTESEDT